MWKNLRLPADPESVHLCAFPRADESLVDTALSEDMAAVQRVISLGLSARMVMRFGIKVGNFVPKNYVRQVVENSDFRKYDDGLRMILDCSPQLAEALERHLAAAAAAGVVINITTSSNGVDKITDLVYKLKSGYRQNATFVMSKQTLGTLRQLKASSGDYIWAPSVIAGSQQWTPSRLLGYSVVEAEDMPAIAANSLSIAFGDFSAGYVIVDRSGMSVLRDPYSNAPYVTFRTVRRVGGGVVDFDAIKLLKFA